MPFSPIFKITLIASVASLLLSIGSLVLRAAYPNVFGWLFFFLPVLWALWVVCLFFFREGRSIKKMIFLWLLIDLITLFLFLSFAMRVPNWAHSQGVEIVVAVSYLPVILPIGFLINALPTSFDHALSMELESFLKWFGGGAGDGLAIWLGLSAVAIIQSAFLVLISQFIWRIRRTPNHSPESANR